MGENEPATRLGRVIERLWGRRLAGDDFVRLAEIMGKSRTQAWRIATGAGSTRDRGAVERLMVHFNAPEIMQAWELDTFPYAASKLEELEARLGEIDTPAARDELEATLAALQQLRVAEAKQVVELVRKARSLPYPLEVVLELLDVELDTLMRRRKLLDHGKDPLTER